VRGEVLLSGEHGLGLFLLAGTSSNPCEDGLPDVEDEHIAGIKKAFCHAAAGNFLEGQSATGIAELEQLLFNGTGCNIGTALFSALDWRFTAQQSPELCGFSSLLANEDLRLAGTLVINGSSKLISFHLLSS